MAGRDLYLIQMAKTGAVKIGRSDHPERRLRQLQTGAPHRLRLLAVGPGLGARERGLHELLLQWRGSGEWFTHEVLNELPPEIYGLLPESYLEASDWWRQVT